ncbi:MAG: hypothetical protein FNNCIFGK_00715 [Bacteroidia bacterium]|nr:hypothetical protein [Bacteroidia bacterium]
MRVITKKAIYVNDLTLQEITKVTNLSDHFAKEMMRVITKKAIHVNDLTLQEITKVTNLSNRFAKEMMKVDLKEKAPINASSIKMVTGVFQEGRVIHQSGITRFPIRRTLMLNLTHQEKIHFDQQVKIVY